ncbi:hypothetical protein FM117_07380 [Micrococcus luteus Mu201]|nr:hypothetical protein FM117_07380 [Micrococcus luteus Mu201]
MSHRFRSGNGGARAPFPERKRRGARRGGTSGRRTTTAPRPAVAQGGSVAWPA